MNFSNRAKCHEQIHKCNSGDFRNLTSASNAENNFLDRAYRAVVLISVSESMGQKEAQQGKSHNWWPWVRAGK
jgi:hypothetical protein